MASSSLSTDGEAGCSSGIEGDVEAEPPVALAEICERCKTASVKCQILNVEDKTNR